MKLPLPHTIAPLGMPINPSFTGLAQTPKSEPVNIGPVQDITFKSIAGKDALTNLGRNLGLKVVFDETAKDRGKRGFSLHKATMRQTGSVILVLQGWSAEYLDEQTIVVFADNPEAQQRYNGLKDWSYKLLSRIRA